MKAKERDIALFFSGFCGACVLGILAIAFLLSLASCSASRPAVALSPPVMAQADSLPILPYLRELAKSKCQQKAPASGLKRFFTRSQPAAANLALVQHLDSQALAGWLPRDYATLPAYLVPAPAGSSPKQRRQWQKAQAQNLARAGVLPAKIKNSALATAPGATAVNRPTSAVATGSGAATDARKSGTRGGSAAVGPGAVATSTSAGVAWWWYLVAAVAGAVVWEYVSSRVAPLRTLLRWRLV